MKKRKENFSSFLTLLLVFKEQVLKNPSKTVIIEGKAEITYRELKEYSLSIAPSLKQAQIKPLDRVAILLPQGISIIASLLGVLENGSVYVSIDHYFPVERIGLMLKNDLVFCFFSRIKKPKRNKCYLYSET